MLTQKQQTLSQSKHKPPHSEVFFKHYMTGKVDGISQIVKYFQHFFLVDYKGLHFMTITFLLS